MAGVAVRAPNPSSHSHLKSLLWRQTSKPKHVLEIRASGNWSHWKNSSLLIFVTRVSIWTNSKCFCLNLFFALYSHASKEEDGDRCSFKTPGWNTCCSWITRKVWYKTIRIWSLKHNMRRQRWWITRFGKWICKLSRHLAKRNGRWSWDWTLKRRRGPRAWHILKRKKLTTLNSLHALVNAPK